jgi:hypothetical protein
MSGPQVTVEMTSEDAKLFAAIQRNARAMGELEGATQKVGRASQEAKKHHEESFGGKAVNDLAKMAMGYLTIEKGIEAINHALEIKHEHESRASNFAAGIAESQGASFLQIATQAEQKRFAAEIAKMASATPIKGGQAAYYNIGRAALGATGGDIEAALRATGIAAATARSNPEIAAELAPGIAELEHVSGWKSGEANLGMLLAVGRESRTGTMNPMMLRAMIGAQGYGATPQEAGALAATMSRLMNDPQGRKASGAAVSFAQHLEKFVTQDIGRKDLATLSQRMEFLKSNPAARQEFLETGGFEGVAGLAAAKLLGERGGTPLFQEILAKIPTEAQAQAIGLERIAGKAVTPQQKSALRQYTQQAVREKSLSGKSGIEAAEEGDFSFANLTKVMQDSGAPWYRMPTKFDYYLQNAGQSNRQYFNKTIEEQADWLEAKGLQGHFMRGPTEAENEQAKILRELLEVTKQMADEQAKPDNPTLGNPGRDE